MGKHELRARDLISRMNIDEKIAQLCSLWLEVDGTGAVAVKSLVGREIPRSEISDILVSGIGQLTRPYGTRPVDAIECMKGLNLIQKHLIEHTRLGIPAMFHEECLAGVMAKGATQFPTGLNYGAMWNPELVKRIGEAIGDELASLGVHQGLAPVLDVSRDVRWGRTEESMGEDPYLVGLTACSYISGFQGQDYSRIATLKHFLGHSASEGGRNHAPVHVGPRELYDVFALPFEMAVKLVKTGSVMPAYHDLDGEPCSASPTILKTVLRDSWGFSGTIVSDYEALSQLCHDHHVASDMTEAAALGIKAGIDMDLPSDTCYRQGLKKALEKGLCEMPDIDACVFHILSQKSRLGVFEHPYGDVGGIQLNSIENHALAVESAVGSLVLLQNDGTLPLHDEKKIALIGPLADDPYAMYAGYAFPTHLMGSYTQEETIPRYSKTIRKSLEALVGRERVMYAKGCDILTNRNGKPVVFPGEVVQADVQRLAPISDDVSKFTEAIDVAGNADVAVVVVGDIAGLFQNGTVGEGSDVSSLNLPGVQQKLLDAVLALDVPTIVVLASGRPYHLGNAHRKANAILATWMPGEGGGEAVAKVLMGKSAPKGRLPISYVTNAGVMPYVYNHTQKSTGVPMQPDYKSIYPFGFGLTYSSFTYEDCSVDNPTAPSDNGEFIIRCIVHNIGYRDAEDVIQLYVRDVCASKVRPVKELKGFKRVPLAAKQVAQVIFKLPVDVLGFCSSEYDRTVEPGEFEIQLGSSSDYIWFVSKVIVTGEKRVLPKKWRMVTEATIVYC